MYCEAASLVEHEPAVAEPEECLRVGDVTVSILSTQRSYITPDLAKFRVPISRSDVQVTLRRVRGIQPTRSRETFDSGAVWKLSRTGDHLVFDFSSPAISPYPYKQLRTSDFISAEMILNSEVLPEDAWALEYPADELLTTNHLARHRTGVEVHGCGLIDPEYGGFLFLGHSGAGKSTTTRLWRSHSNPEILSDDRIILRLQEGELWMYGTPWHGEAAFASAAKAKLSRIFILQHGERNRIVELRPALAVAELFARCFPPFHSSRGLQNVMEFLERVCETVPCYEFQFVPDESAVTMALNVHG